MDKSVLDRNNEKNDITGIEEKGGTVESERKYAKYLEGRMKNEKELRR